MKEDTPEDKQVIAYRQANCKHSFIKGAADLTPRCAHCGMSKVDFEAQGWGAIP